jgi:hypothetical protein
VGRKLLTIAVVGLSLMISGCAVTPSGPSDNTPAPTQTFDPALIPTAPPSDALAVDVKVFDTGLGEYTFKVGGGPTWCTLNPTDKFALCEQNEADATYDALTPPASCKLSYGYQFQLFGTKPSKGSAAQITCASGLYADPAQAQTLNPGETLTVGDITCFVTDITARCDNKSGNYIVLGPEVWALG